MKGASARSARLATDMPPDTPTTAASTETSKVGILAGGGGIPVEIAHAVNRSGREVHIVAIDPGVDTAIADFPHDRIGLGQVGRMLQVLRAQHCHDVIIAGSLTRPDLFALRIDWGFVRHLPRILRLMRGGDDSVLRRVISFFESQGFAVRGIADVAPELLSSPGAMTEREPTTPQHDNLADGYAVIQELGRYDIGQGVVIRGGKVVAVEAAEGTDAMLERLAAQSGSGGLLVKAAKPGQELRIDLPTIGPRTVTGAHQAGLDMIAVEAGRSVLAERSKTLALAEQHGIAIYGIPPAIGREHRPRHAGQHQLTAIGRKPIANRSRRDAALAQDILLTLARHDSRASVVVSHEFVLAVGVEEDPVHVIERALTCLPWGRRRRRRLPGVIAVDAAGLATPGLLKAVAGSGLSGLVIIGQDNVAMSAQDIAAADRLNLFIAGVNA